MLSLLLLMLLLLPPAVLAVASGRRMVLYLLLIGGIPITTFMPGVTFLHAFGGVAPQAALLLAMVFALWVAFVFRMDVLLRESVRYLAFLLFLVLALASLAWGDDLVFGLRTLVKLWAPFLFFAAVLSFLRTERDLQAAERMVFACCLVVLGLALSNHFSGGALSDAHGLKWVQTGVLTAPFMSPANFSFLMACGALLALANFLARPRLLFLVLYAVLAGAVLWAFTRIAMAGLVVGTSVCVLLLARSGVVKALFPPLLCVVFAVSLFTVDSFKSRMFFEPKKVEIGAVWANPGALKKTLNTSGRTHLWEQAGDRFLKDSPLAGAGMGSVDAWLSGRLHVELHSEYLRILFELGALGLALYVTALLHFAWNLRRLLKAPGHPAVRKYAALGLAALGCYAVTLATDNSLNYVTEFGLYVYAFMAFAFVAQRHYGETATEPASAAPWRGHPGPIRIPEAT